MSYEIEQKAHVYNREQVIQILNNIAIYKGSTNKKDLYYNIPNKENSISVRLRTERKTLNSNISINNYLTYKRKEIINKDESPLEVNEEQETTISDINVIKSLFSELNAYVELEKEKFVEDWEMEINNEIAHIELCTVPPLGDFLEIEIIKEDNKKNTIKKCKDCIKEIFSKCNIPLTQIESKYYRELLNQTDNKKNRR